MEMVVGKLSPIALKRSSLYISQIVNCRVGRSVAETHQILENGGFSFAGLRLAPRSEALPPTTVTGFHTHSTPFGFVSFN